ncbi:MAG: hypothetical protein HKP55_06695 [Gammaproteobacteria bacterium]|nr:hypothetical protein [Gammaproteobacteria bacterium]
MSAKKKLSDGVNQYEDWKKHTLSTIKELEDWLENHGLFSEEAWNTLARCFHKLESDRITIAFVGEFSRGKTELINALFFSDTGRRLLPSDAGRTTMCPTEILYDDQRDEAYIRLLPIETRLSDHTLTELQKMPDEWHEILLDPNDSDSLENSFRELASTLHVTPDQARQYGLLNEDVLHPHGRQPKYIDIPKWRHAIISYPHTLLKHGLNILDTPGLNAIGTEPELTLTMLPSAQAAIFVLGADTGVTQTDLDIWQHNLYGHQKQRRNRLTVVLNKVDTLWDELRSPKEIEDSIKSQILFTARTLGVPLSKIFPLSAQKSLFGLVRKDQDLIKRGGIIELEDHVNHQVTQSKQEIIIQDITAELVDLLEKTGSVIKNRLSQEESQIEEMSNIHQQSAAAIEKLLKDTQQEQDRFRLNSNALKHFGHSIDEKARELQETLDQRVFEQALTEARDSMEKSWTSKGVQEAVSAFSRQLKLYMMAIERKVAENSQLIKNIYQRFANDHGIGVIQPKAWTLDEHQKQLDAIIEEASAFGKGHRISLTGQSKVARNFFTTIGHNAKELFSKIQREINHWVNSSLQPLAFQIEDHRDMLNRKVQDLKIATQSREMLETKLTESTDRAQVNKQQIEYIGNLIDQLNQRHIT